MKLHSLVSVCASVVCTLLLQPIVSTAGSQSLDSLVRAELETARFSGVVLLADKGVPIASVAVGQASDATGMTIDTRFRLASITKAFTAVLVMQLVEQQRLRVTSTVAALLPDLRIERAASITVEDLLLHRSGLPNEPDSVYDSPRDARTVITQTVATEPFQKYGAFSYSNLDYLVLALIIESLTGKSFDTVLQERILAPVGMTHSGIANVRTPNLARGYVTDSAGNLQSEPALQIENFGAAGAMYGTASDLLKFDQALYTTRLLQPASIDSMYVSHPELGYVAYGSWVYEYYFLPSKPKVVERRGGILGFNHAFIRMPGINRTLIMLSNNNRFNPDTFGQLDSLKDKLIKALVEYAASTAPE